MFTEVNPDKGTKTCNNKIFWRFINVCVFTEVNPDKGTETLQRNQNSLFLQLHLQNLTPIRGRKQYSKIIQVHICHNSLQKLPLIRGRKLLCDFLSTFPGESLQKLPR